MNRRRFALRPWDAAAGLDLQLPGRVARQGPRLIISYALQGRLQEVVIPEPAEKPGRRPGLWRETCFEFFVGPPGSPRYWEFNLSPGGLWNAYRFAGYRRGLEEEEGLSAMPFTVARDRDSLRLRLEVNLAGILGVAAPWKVGVAAVLKLAGGRMTYWALCHVGEQPDFHRRESFTIVV